MLNFHRTAATSRNYLSRREQRRLLLWVFLLGLPIIAVLRIWDLWQSTPAPVRPAADGANIDPRLPEPPKSLPTLDAFTVEPLAEHQDDGEPQEAQNAGDRYFRGVNPEYLRSVRDDTLSRPADRDACFNLFQVLNRTDPSELKAASLGQTAYVQLFRQPEVYRGKLVDLRGTVRRAHRLPLAKNHTGLTHNYELWLFTKDSGTNPIKVYALDLPEGFPTGMKINEPVELTGFFFKRVAYGAKGGGMTAPMLLVKTVQWKAPSPQQQAETADKTSRRLQWLTAIALVGIVIMAGIMVWANRLIRRPIVPRLKASPDSLTALQDADVVNVEDELQRLSREES